MKTKNPREQKKRVRNKKIWHLLSLFKITHIWKLKQQKRENETKQSLLFPRKRTGNREENKGLPEPMFCLSKIKNIF